MSSWLTVDRLFKHVLLADEQQVAEVWNIYFTVSNFLKLGHNQSQGAPKKQVDFLLYFTGEKFGYHKEEIKYMSPSGCRQK